ncbi:hypothetical protein BpHYR1_025800, partial [Brachionus plicatilis]
MSTSKENSKKTNIQNNRCACCFCNLAHIHPKTELNNQETKLPSCFPPSQKQLTTEEANNTRLVTKCRIITNYESSLMTTRKMLNRLNKPNDLIKFSQHFIIIKISEINDFHKLDLKDIENDITFGKYQLGQCI